MFIGLIQIIMEFALIFNCINCTNAVEHMDIIIKRVNSIPNHSWKVRYFNFKNPCTIKSKIL